MVLYLGSRLGVFQHELRAAIWEEGTLHLLRVLFSGASVSSKFYSPFEFVTFTVLPSELWTAPESMQLGSE